MAFQTFSGPIRCGTVKEGSARNTGLVELAQSDTVAGSDTTKTSSIILPAWAQITEVIFDVTTGFNGTTPTVAVGISGGSTTQFLTAITAASAGRVDARAAQQVANFVDATGVERTLTFTVGGTSVTTGAGRVTVRYIQRGDGGVYAPATP